MQQQDLLPHLFRSEYSKIVAVLIRRFGFAHMAIAEDLASETFMAAAQSWGLQGLPVNPVAWLYSTAKNKARNYLQRQAIFDVKIAPALQQNAAVHQELMIDLSAQNITDSQLQMMFAICDPSIPAGAQIGLSLQVLCGFGIDEIAEAFLTNKETINKRLYRAREKLRSSKTKLTLPEPTQIDRRLKNVLTTIYLLFSEGYYSSSTNRTINKELCMEAIGLCHLLIDNKATNTPEVKALLGLMYFQASRLDARMGANGKLILYEDQDISLWDYNLISKGGYYLNLSATGNMLSAYHLQAAIAYWNTKKTDSAEKWENILHLYNQLLQVAYSPIAALNRTYALARVRGKQAAIIEAEKLKLTKNHFYFMLLGEIYTDVDNDIAQQHFATALLLAKTPADKESIKRRMDKS